MKNVQVVACNVDYPHERDYVLDRPYGCGQTYVFMHFLTPFEIRTTHGIEIGHAGQCLCYAPGFAQWNRGTTEPIRNNWIHFEGVCSQVLIERAGIPCNVIFTPSKTDFIEPSVRLMRQEIYEHRYRYEDALALMLQLFLLQLGRDLKESASANPAMADLLHLEALRQLRARIHERLAEPWSTDIMARQVNLSRSRFAVLYKKVFGIPPLEDLLQARITCAQRLLSNARLTVETVSERCGFQSSVHFYRMFRKRVGCTPREYVRMHFHELPPDRPGSHHITSF